MKSKSFESHGNQGDGFLTAVNIRHVEEADLPALEWEGEYAHFRHLYADIFRRTQRNDAIMWLAELKDNHLIGQLFVQLSSGRPELADGYRRAYIYGFRVKPVFQNRGIGTRMMQVAETDLIQRGYRKITLNVGQDNQGARRLYERLGYIVVTTDPGVWSYIDQYGQRQVVKEPAWRMEKQLKSDVIS